MEYQQCRKNNNCLFYAIGINAVFLLMVILFCDMKYEVSDDFVMDAILSGAYGTGYDAHLLYSNILYGSFLKVLYEVFPVVSWYFIFQILICFLSLCSVSYIILQMNQNIAGVVLTIAFVSFFSDDLYILVQFTKTAAVSICSGGVLLLFGLWSNCDKKRRRGCILCGIILTLAGTMVRFSCIYIALVFLFLMFLRHLWGYHKTNVSIKKPLQNLMICVFLILVAFTLNLYNTFIWDSEEEYAAYRDYDYLRMSITDTKSYGYDSVDELTKESGLSETDFYMISSWNFLDKDYYTEEVQTAVAEAKEEYHQNHRTIRSILGAFYNRHYERYTIAVGLVFLFVLLWILEPGMAPRLIFELGLTVLLLLYFCWSGRTVYRVEYSIFVCAAISILTAFRVSVVDMRKIRFLAVLGILLCVCKIPLYIPDTNYLTMTDEEYQQYIYDTLYLSGSFNIQKYRCNVNSRQPYSELIAYIESDYNGYYLMDFGTTIQLLYYNYKPWYRVPAGLWSSYSYLGGVSSHYPSNDTVWEVHSIDSENPYKSLINDNIYVVDNENYEWKLAYLRERYYPEARLELVDVIDGFYIWKFYKE